MCGICCLVFQGDCEEMKKQVRFDFVGARGPDISHSETVELTEKWKLQLFGHVLHLRGTQPTGQPLCSSNGDIFLWNGEIFDGIEVKYDENDTRVLFTQLLETENDQQLLDKLDKIEGPWAFIFWQKSSKRLWFGRDRLGRRSLLWHLPSHKDDMFSLSSVSLLHQDLYEIPAVGVFCLHLDVIDEAQQKDLVLYPWDKAQWPGTSNLVEDEINLPTNIYPDHYSNINIFIHNTCKLQTWLPQVNTSLPSPEFKPCDLSNMSHEEYLRSLLENDEMLRKAAEQLIEVLERSVQKRVNNIPDFNKINGGTISPETNENKSPDQGHARLAVLFSGGIDSTVLAALADRCVPKDEAIDLLNVAFEQQPKGQPNTMKKGKQIKEVEIKDRFRVPDRITGYAALEELNPERKWNFVEINVTQDELKHIRSERVRHLVYPSCTVLDDSIGCAVWFAARGKGTLTNGANNHQDYTSTARVILCGMGADEQLAGYSRHRSRYSDGSWKGLIDEIQMEIYRISARNLGRDDRIIGDHGKEARFPFLDENVVRHLSSLPIHVKTQLDLPRGLGEKLLLRLSAYQMSLYKTSCFPKRAIQFGSRIAKMENSKEKASEKCERLINEMKKTVL